MHDIRHFDSVEEMLEAISEAQEQGKVAYESMPESAKRLLVPGQHFLIPTDHGFCIFGEIIESEYDEDKKSLAAAPHLRLIRAFSVACEKGEVGTQFACNLLPIPKYLFDLAKDRKWDFSLEDLVELFAAKGFGHYEEEL
jgi:hypothetical protein